MGKAVSRIASPSGLVLTTYESLRAHRGLLLPVHWGVVVLDEGHKIRNPDAEITQVAKQVSLCQAAIKQCIKSLHSVILSMSFIQWHV